MRRRLAAVLSVILGLSFAVAVPGAASADPIEIPSVVINEIQPDDAVAEDWVELANTGDTDVDISGWIVRDDKNTSTLRAGLVVPAGGYLVLSNKDHFDFGLGKSGDEVHVALPDGTIIDEYAFTSKPATTWGRCPDGTGEFGLTEAATPGAANDCPAPAGPENITINEVTSQGEPADWVELHNDGTTPVDISGWMVRDAKVDALAPLPEGTIVPAGGYLVLQNGTHFAFGLGDGDQFHLYLEDGTTLVDETAWPADTHAEPSWGRCPDVTGAFEMTATATPGAVNDCVRPVGADGILITEVSSDPDDWAEIHNTGDADVDISGWHVDDSSPREDVLPSGTIVPAGGYVVLTNGTHFDFGLGKGDQFRLFLADGVTLVDETQWTADAHADPSWGRCPDATGEFVMNVTATPGAVNDCPEVNPVGELVLNEVESSGEGADWVEIYNPTATAIDMTGLVIADAGEPKTTIAATSIVPAGGYVVVETSGLGGADSARLFAADGTTLIDETSWTATADETWGRCPDAVGAFGETEAPTPGAANDCPPPAGWQDVVINEVESSGGEPGDWIELHNTGDVTVDLTSWILRDNVDEHAFVIAPGTLLAPGGFLAVVTDVDPDAFGLGNPDTARLYLPGGETLVDSYAWEDHAERTTYGRCPDGTGEFVLTFSPTKDAANDCSPVRINEVDSKDADPVDWVELVNIGDESVDVSGYVLRDNKDTSEIVIADGTTMAPGTYLAVDVDREGGFGLGGADEARLFAADGTTLLGSVSWSEHAPTSWARCPDGLGAFEISQSVTKGAMNECVGIVPATAWPGGQGVTTVSVENQFGGDLSGLAYEATGDGRGTLWAVQNGDGLLYKLEWNSAAWVPVAGEWAQGKELVYPDGGGTVDAEGVGFVGSSASGIYVASERNNDGGGSRPSVLLYDVSASGTTLTASAEWNLANLLPTLAANQGLEGITWIPDSALVAGGLVDEATGEAYDPTRYAGHGDGLFFVGVEGTARIYAVALISDGSAALVATIDPKLAVVADVFYDASTGLLWAACDDACDGQTAVLTIAEDGPLAGTFQVTSSYEAPSGMAENIANEGFAIGSALCADGHAPVFYADDSETDGYSIREATIVCTTSGGGSGGSGGGDSGSGGGLTPVGDPVAPSESALTPQTQNQIQAPNTAVAGETITIVVGTAYAGQLVDGWVFSTPTYLGQATVSASGSVTFTVPAGLAAGTHRLVVTDSTGAVIGWVYVEITGLAATGGSVESAGIPVLPWAAAVLLLGLAMVVIRRRAARRDA